MAVKNVTKADFDKVLKNDQPVLVDFWAPWCNPCKMLGPELEKAAEAVGDTAVIAKVNVDEEADLARQFRVMSIPTMVLFMNGKETARLVGFNNKDEIISFIDKHR